MSKLFLPSRLLKAKAPEAAHHSSPPSTELAVTTSAVAVTEPESHRALTRMTLAAIERIDGRINGIAESVRSTGESLLSSLDERLASLERLFEERVAQAEAILVKALEAMLEAKHAAATAPAQQPAPAQSPISSDHDLRALSIVFLKESLDGVTDRARKSTYKSAFDFWWAMWEATEQGFPDEPSIERFGKRCRAASSQDYAISRQRVMRKWREWLMQRGIIAVVGPLAMPAPAAMLALPAPESTGSTGSTASSARLTRDDLSQIANTVRDSLFGGEASEDHWAVVVRRVSSAIGVRGIAAICGVDLDVAEKWIQLKRIPRHNREQLEHAWMLVLLKKAQTKHGKDVEDLWDEMLTVENFFSGTGPGFDEV